MQVSDQTYYGCTYTNGHFSARFEMGFTPDRPRLFVGATNQELIEHCSTEHHDAWQQLRSSV